MNSERETGGIIGGWLLKVTLPLVLAGVVIVDVGSISVARFGAADEATQAAIAAAETVSSKDGLVSPATVVGAYNAASAVTARDGATVSRDDFTVYPDGRVHLTVEKHPYTVICKHVTFLKGYTNVYATVTQGKPTY